MSALLPNRAAGTNLRGLQPNHITEALESAMETIMSQPIEFAVYEEHSDAKKPVAPGLNIRVFNRIGIQQGESISLDLATGNILLQPGLYHITASSLVAYFDPMAEDETVVPMSPLPPGGYCVLIPFGAIGGQGMAQDALALGTVSNADMIPSLIETYLTVENEPMTVVVAHQVGDSVAGIFLQVDATGSTSHVFARIAIRRLS